MTTLWLIDAIIFQVDDEIASQDPRLWSCYKASVHGSVLLTSGIRTPGMQRRADGAAFHGHLEDPALLHPRITKPRVADVSSLPAPCHKGECRASPSNTIIGSAELRSLLNLIITHTRKTEKLLLPFLFGMNGRRPAGGYGIHSFFSSVMIMIIILQTRRYAQALLLRMTWEHYITFTLYRQRFFTPIVCSDAHTCLRLLLPWVVGK